MGISVNGVDIDDAQVEQELAHHQGAGNPLKQAVHELVLRRLLLDEARRLGLAAASDDELVEALFAQEVKVPVADDAACRTFYAQRPQLFRSGALVEARHILFQVTPGGAAGPAAHDGAGGARRLESGTGALCRAGGPVFELPLGRAGRQPGPAVARPERAGVRRAGVPAGAGRTGRALAGNALRLPHRAGAAPHRRQGDCRTRRCRRRSPTGCRARPGSAPCTSICICWWAAPKSTAWSSKARTARWCNRPK